MRSGPVRALALLSIPAGAGWFAVQGRLRRLAGANAEAVRRDVRTRTVERTRRVLGGARGGALKVGQFLSAVEALFAPDPDRTWQQALATMQADNPGMPWGQAHSVLTAELGPAWREAFAEFEIRPAPRSRSARCTGRAGVRGRRLGARSQSRSSTRGCARRSSPTCGCWPGSVGWPV